MPTKALLSNHLGSFLQGQSRRELYPAIVAGFQGARGFTQPLDGRPRIHALNLVEQTFVDQWKTLWIQGFLGSNGAAQWLALPPFRPALFFCADVPPWLLSPPVPLLLPPRFEAPGELAIFAARSFDMPLSLRASYCFSFLTFADLLGMAPPSVVEPPRYPATARS